MEKKEKKKKTASQHNMQINIHPCIACAVMMAQKPHLQLPIHDMYYYIERKLQSLQGVDTKIFTFFPLKSVSCIYFPKWKSKENCQMEKSETKMSNMMDVISKHPNKSQEAKKKKKREGKQR